MPNRILRDWTDSETIHALTVEAERFFTRLIMKADDYGRYHANIKLLRANLFPLHDKLKDDKVILWLTECEDAGLLSVYQVGGKMYLEIKMFDQKLKVRRSKYPPSNGEDRLALQEGYVYIIGTDYTKPVKIGFSVNPWSRLKEITSNNHEHLEILLTIKTDKRMEPEIHRSLKALRTKNEWFQLNPNIVNEFIEYSKSNSSRECFLESLRSNSYELRSSTETETEVETEYEVEKKREEGHPLKNSNLFRQPKIPSKQQVWEVFSSHGGTKEMAKKFFENNESVGWFVRGSPITNFSNLVPGFIETWNRIENKGVLPDKVYEPGKLSEAVKAIEAQEQLKKVNGSH